MLGARNVSPRYEPVEHGSEGIELTHSGASYYQPSGASSFAAVNTAYTPSDDNLLLQSERGRNRGQRQRTFFTGWRIGASASLVGVTLVFILTLVLTIYVKNNPDYKAEGNFGTLYKGDCKKVRTANIWFHLLVNTLSTLLLAASNYCMQIIVSPNRGEVEKAHAKNIWLQIGVPNIGNLRHIGGGRSLFWLLLLLSSMPLHLLYNSVIFTNLQANNYAVLPITEPWLNGEPYDFSGFVSFNNSFRWWGQDFEVYRPNMTDQVTLSDGSKVMRYKTVATADCFDSYNSHYVSNVGDVYIVHDEPPVWRNKEIWGVAAHNETGEFTWYNRTGLGIDEAPENFTMMPDQGSIKRPPNSDRNMTYLSPLYPASFDNYPSNQWRCATHRRGSCDIQNENEVPRDRSKWAPYEKAVKHCIVEVVPENCQLRFNFLIAGIVLVANAVKIVIFCGILLLFRKHNALVTLGDALKSFLDRPDQYTKGRCLQPYSEIKMQWHIHQDLDIKRSRMTVQRHTERPILAPKVYQPERRIWASSPSGLTWASTYFLYVMALIFGALGAINAMRGLQGSVRGLVEIGLGIVQGNNLLPGNLPVMKAVLLANMPQVVLSYLYLAMNTIYTNMFIGQEWSRYVTQRKTLRVTERAGQQRGTYWLSIPYRYGIPMTAVSALYHWVTSQGLFMVQITIVGSTPRAILPKEQVSTCGVSPLGLFLTLLFTFIIAVSGILVGRIRYPLGMPLAGSCSAAISAACHPPKEDVDASLKPVQWGAVDHGSGEIDGEDAAGHCTFTSFPVEPPIEGRLYE